VLALSAKFTQEEQAQKWQEFYDGLKQFKRYLSFEFRPEIEFYFPF